MVVVMVRGSESAAFQEEMRKMNAEAVKVDDTDGKKTVQDVHNELVRRVAPLITGFKNINRGSKPATADDAEWFLNLQTVGICKDGKAPVFAMQVSEFAMQRTNFLGNASGG